MAAVLLQSPEESFRPTTVSGNALIRRPISGSEKPTWATGGM